MVIVLWAPLLFTSCQPGPYTGGDPSHQPTNHVQTQASSPEVTDACALVLIPHRGNTRADQEITRLQEEAKTHPASTNLIEKLGWMYVRKARESFDPGFYKLAEQCG